MSDGYYVVFDGWDKSLAGYPINFSWADGFDREKHGAIDGTFDSCAEEQLEARVKHSKICFDFHSAPGKHDVEEFFVSESFLNVIKTGRTFPFRYKPIQIFGKNRKPISEKEYYVVSFYDMPDYVNRGDCRYVIPSGPAVYNRDIVDVSINSNVLNEFDILPSIIPTFPSSLIVSEKLKNSDCFANMNFEYLPLKDAASIVFGREYEDYDDIDIDMLQTLPRYSEQELNQM